ncbi:uncharacterized protein LOC135087159 [Ostrinia nubilalis]|uniref:uncharacterized protein LOC135087159 n=1 Tax=Ostrinia nubilalis TaxID=29057 RepID=UPI0030825A55
MWPEIGLVCLLASATVAINRPVYKVVLTQKGFTQFLQYDVETPPLREFTFCTWIRLYDLGGDQSIFTYVANGNNRVVRLWLDSGGRNMKVSINGRVISSIPVEIVKDVWRHVCLSYQSDYGAWAIYIDAKLVLCGVAQSLQGFLLPKGGSLIIGYGTADNGGPSGLEGEIFGANMILTSTIERNHTTKLNHLYDQKAFKRNKVKSSDKNIKYVILSDLRTDEIHNNFEKAQGTPIQNKTKSYVKFRTPHSNFEHNVGLELSSKKTHDVFDTSNEKEIFDFSVTDHIDHTTTDKNKINFWNLVNKAGHEGKFKVQKKTKLDELSGSSTQDLAMISEYETPPPPPVPSVKDANFNRNKKVTKPPKSIYNISPEIDGYNTQNLQNKNKATVLLPDVDTPPPLPEKDTKVYGQWTSSKFAGSVLNYLKSINFNYNREKKAPSTIPLNKISDNYPYASDFKLTKLRPPVQFQRKNLIDHKIKIKKRGINDQPQINVQILEDDLRSTILKQHAETKAKNVEVSSRGQTVLSNRFYRNVDSQVSVESSESIENIYKPRPFKVKSIGKKKINALSDFDLHRNNNLMTILPFLKSLEYFVEDSQNTKSDNVVRSSDMYSKSLSNGNKWHNVKSYNNDYTPRRMNIDSDEGKSYIDAKIAEANLKHPSIRLKYKHENHKVVKNNDDPTILKGRELAMSVSNQSNANRDTISIVKYNHGFLPSHDTKLKNSEKINSVIKIPRKNKRLEGKNNFNKHVKLGNALNERDVIGYNEEDKKQSFLGGNDKIPDINRYRSDLDNENFNVPSSLGPRVCRDVDLDDHALYVQPDQSIDTSHILSPVKMKNIGIEFIQQNYKKCSLDGSDFAESYLLFIDWSKTPVRLFGGAYPKTTTDLCGFFKK